jgi:hypothetical protein
MSHSSQVEDPGMQPLSLLMPLPHKDDNDGFTSIFDGETLQGWEGDAAYWRVESGSLVGETTPATLLTKNNSFLIWRGGLTRDFELRLEYRITRGGNSGINYRSEELLEPKWAMTGYQFDIDGPDWGKEVLSTRMRHLVALSPFFHFRVTGQNYEELGREFLALPGQLTEVLTEDSQRLVGFVNSPERIDEIATDDWNAVRIIARSSVLIHILNRRITSIVIDDDVKNRRSEGKLGVQVHVGPPMKVEFRRIWLKNF